MAALRSRNAVVLFKTETTAGTDASPVAADDAVLVENPQIQFNPNIVRTNEVTGSLDSRGAIVGGMTAQISCDVYLKGSGTAGTAPEFGPLLKACGWAETLTGTAVPASAEACGATGSTTTATLGTSASSTADAYNGMPIDFTGNVEGSSFIADYTAAKLATLTDTMSGAIDASTSYQIPANVLYAPASSSISAGTMYVYMDGVLYEFVGCRGTTGFALQSGGPGRIRFQFNGIFEAKTDAAVPTATYDTTRPPIWKGGKALVNRVASAMAALSVDANAQVINPDNPNATEGYDPAEIVSRNMQGQMDPLETLIATRDVMADFRAGAQRIIHARYGSTAGNRVGLTVPAGLFTNQTPADRNGLSAVTVPFDCVGQDGGAYLCFY